MRIIRRFYSRPLQAAAYFFCRGLRSRIILAIAVLLVFLLSLSILTQSVSASEHPERIKKVISIEIKSGDTLWAIATQYYTDEYDSISDYVTEIKATNHLHSDTIHSGNYLVIPYYTEANNSL